MILLNEDLFYGRSLPYVDAIVITTNGQVKNDGRLVMGKGCAKRAHDMYPNLDLTIGFKVSQFGNHVYSFQHFPKPEPAIVSFPVKDHWNEPAKLWLIERSCEELVVIADKHGWERIWIVQPGTGAGGLTWKEVKPILTKHFDGRFTVCNLE